MAGRTLSRWTRVYVGGYDLSGYSREIGPLVTQYDVASEAALSDAVKGGLPSHVRLGVGTLNGFMDNTATSGLHVLHSAPGSSYVVQVAIGDRAAPAAGVPVYAGRFYTDAYTFNADDAGLAHVSIPFGDWDIANLVDYQRAWGALLHANSAVTAVNTSGTGVDDNYLGASTAFGGFMAYHVTAGDGTATITVQHSATEVNANYANLGGCTTGSIDCSSVQSGIVTTTAKTTTVNRYLRWQIVFGTATTVTFVLSFHRSHHATT